MFVSFRTSLTLALAFVVASCSAAQTQSAPQTAPASGPAALKITNPVSKSLPKKKLSPNEVIGGGGGAKGMLQVLLGDAALPNGSTVQAINLGIDSISVTDTYGNVTTIASYSTPQVVNVLQYQGGNTTPIAQGNAPTTTFASLTIVVDRGTSNYVDGAGTAHHLYIRNMPSQSTANFGTTTSTIGVNGGAYSAASSSAAITFNQAFQMAGNLTTIDVDFNAMESLLPSGSLSRPSLSVAQQGFDGGVSGVVQNAYGGVVSNAVVVAVDGNGNPQATTVTDQNGNFLLDTLVAGTYNLVIYNAYVTASGWAVNAVNSDSTGTVQAGSAGVSPGQNTSVGTIQD